MECWKAVPAGVVCENPYIRHVDRERNLNTQAFNTDHSNIQISNTNQQPEEGSRDSDPSSAFPLNPPVPQELAANLTPDIDETNSYQNVIVERNMYAEPRYDFPGCLDTYNRDEETGGTKGV